MTYRGYEIDKNNVYGGFKSKTEIDEFYKKNAVAKFIKYNKLFNSNPSMAWSMKCSEQAKVLHNDYGFTYEEIEELEIKAMEQD